MGTHWGWAPVSTWEVVMRPHSLSRGGMVVWPHPGRTRGVMMVVGTPHRWWAPLVPLPLLCVLGELRRGCPPLSCPPTWVTHATGVPHRQPGVPLLRSGGWRWWVWLVIGPPIHIGVLGEIVWRMKWPVLLV